MKAQSMLLSALAAAPAALAHTVWTDFYVDGMPQGDGVAMRMNLDAAKASSPIASLDSDDMACNVGGTKGVSRVQPVKDGALLTFEIRAWPNDATKERLDDGHRGPCAVYLKKVDRATTDKAAGDGWFKIFDHGYNSETKRWCTDEIIDNDGLLSVHLPKGLEPGDYLARPELLALHNALNDDPQMYTGCAQIFLEGNGNLVPESTVSIPGYMKYGTPSTNFDIYNTPNSEYVLPGPPVAKLKPRGSQSASASTTQPDGQKPAGCIMENANWCGKEVPDYTDEKGCWASAEQCWTQMETCYTTSPPTGSAGCELWGEKCEGISDACKAKKFNGPPNKGKVLTPAKKQINPGSLMPTVGGGVATNAEASKTQMPAKTTADVSETQMPAKSTLTAELEESAKPTSVAPKPTVSDAYEAPISTITVAPSSANAPAPTEASCPKGWKCFVETHVEVVTETVYVTATMADGYRKRATVHQRRHLPRA
ncbi:hypothetical protein BDW02DRAFT_155491 [Decorospora gaudefroyi]|uniref:AA9 family lytic polysaccharide monooxygenase n=1 Tax=Decorospora gaudefroyi TaxID=184978 RepID=A0A6A5KVS4_9PLEO|nr:hypothetical protein BDW02DRAFT_155491 [Decorospora gaudefroyi]